MVVKDSGELPRNFSRSEITHSIGQPRSYGFTYLQRRLGVGAYLAQEERELGLVDSQPESPCEPGGLWMFKK